MYVDVEAKARLVLARELAERVLQSNTDEELKSAIRAIAEALEDAYADGLLELLDGAILE